MERKEFYKAVLSLSGKYFDEEILKCGSLKLHSQEKNNDVVLWGIMVELFDKGPSPLLYLDEFYEEYQEGQSLDETMEKVADIYKQAWNERQDKCSFDFTFENVKEKIIFKIINGSKNKSRLEKLEHRLLGNDLAMIFAIKIQEDSIVNISKNFADEFEYDREEIYKCAMENTPKYYPVYFRDMLKHLEEFETSPEDEDAKNKLYILTNTEKLYGAGTAFYPGVLEDISKELGGNFYCIPSSVHEWLVFSEENYMEIRDYHKMIIDINENIVQSTEVLGDYLFKYDFKSKEFFVIVPKEETKYN